MYGRLVVTIITTYLKGREMQEVQSFSSEAFAVLATLNQQTAHFRAADVARQLGYANCSQAIRKNVRAKYVTTLAALRGVSTGDTLVSPNESRPESDSDLYLSEPGLYALILRSKKKEAEAFQDWICEEVLPQIRLNGGLMTGVPRIGYNCSC